MNKKLIRNIVSFFGCIGLVIGIAGIVVNNYTVVLASTIEMLLILIIRCFCRERKTKGDD
jgi:uncharacterized membrane protein YbaN (DUF454 family)